MLITFPLSSLPDNAVIQKAELVLHAIPLDESAFFYKTDTRYSRASTLSLFCLTKDWHESDMDSAVAQWAPYENEFASSASATFSYDSTKESALFDVTETIKEIHNGTFENYGFAMLTDYRYNYADGTGGSMSYWHSTQSQTDSLRPVLKVTYEGDDVELFELTVEDGSGSGFYSVNDTISIVAKDSTDYTFVQWEGDTAIVNEVNSRVTSVVMPDYSASLKAVYRKDSVSLNAQNTLGQSEVVMKQKSGNVQVFATCTESGFLRVYSLQGRKLYENKVHLIQGINSVTLPLVGMQSYLLVLDRRNRQDRIKVVHQ